MAADYQMLGQFDLMGVPPAPRGVPQIEVTFDIDPNGICNVSAKDKATGKEQTVRIQSSGGLRKRESVEANTAETQVIQAEKAITEWKHISGEKQQVTEAIQQTKDAIANKNSTPEQLQEANDKLQKLVMDCGKKDYEAAAAANASSSTETQSEEKNDEEKK